MKHVGGQTLGLNLAAFPDSTRPPSCFHFVSGVRNEDSVDQTPVAKSKNQECEPIGFRAGEGDDDMCNRGRVLAAH